MCRLIQYLRASPQYIGASSHYFDIQNPVQAIFQSPNSPHYLAQTALVSVLLS